MCCECEALIGCFVKPLGCVYVCVSKEGSARSHIFGLWAHGSLVINWAAQPVAWEKGEDPRVSGSFLLGITLGLTVNCHCPRMIVEGSLIYGKRKYIGKYRGNIYFLIYRKLLTLMWVFMDRSFHSSELVSSSKIRGSGKIGLDDGHFWGTRMTIAPTGTADVCVKTKGMTSSFSLLSL